MVNPIPTHLSCPKHLRMSRLSLMFLGIWPFKYDHKSRLLRTSYEVYRISLYIYYITMSCCQWLKIYYFRDDNVDEILENLGVSLLYSVNMVKVGICCSKGATNLILQIAETEERIFAGIFQLMYF